MGRVWLDHVSLIPQDHVYGVKREVFEWAKGLHAGMLRLGGNFISGYHWRPFAGPVLQRPNAVNEAWGGWIHKYFGTDEFLSLSKALGAEPLICVNAGSGTPQEAAEWVAYCRRHPAGPVRYWEIGNELWGDFQIGHCGPDEYANRLLAFVEAMKAEDPAIKVLAVGDTDMDWNERVLRRAVGVMDYLTIHIYPGLRTVGLTPESPESLRYSRMVSVPAVAGAILDDARAVLRKYDPTGRVKLAITEYNVMYQPSSEREGGLAREQTLEGALAVAGILNEFLRRSDDVAIATFSDLVNGWQGGCIRVGNYNADQRFGPVADPGGHLHVYGTPAYYVLRWYGRELDHLVQVDVKCPSLTAQLSYRGRTLDPAPMLDVVAGRNAEGEMTVFLLNRGEDPVATTVQWNGVRPGHGTAEVLTGPGPDAHNTSRQPAAVVPRAFPLAFSDGATRYEAPPRSLTMLTVNSEL